MPLQFLVNVTCSLFLGSRVLADSVTMLSIFEWQMPSSHLRFLSEHSLKDSAYLPATRYHIFRVLGFYLFSSVLEFISRSLSSMGWGQCVIKDWKMLEMTPIGN